ncbi:jun dimerization protein 2 isoform X1 [Lampetra fluviatilis]
MMMMIAPRHLDHSGCQRSALGRDTSASAAEEMERRRRRRERNKVAAAKCRNKKKERTEFLLQESEILEVQNSRLKSLIEKLRGERRRLELALSQHRGACRAHGDADESEQRLVLTQLTEQRGP